MQKDIGTNCLEQLSNSTLYGSGDSDRHVMPLFAIALASRGKRFLELGVRDGVTTLPLLEAAKRTGGMLYSVDIKETNFKCPQELLPYWTFVQSDALAFLERQTPDIAFDIVFIDDWHCFSHVKKELKLLERLTTPTSIILLHDLMYGSSEPRYHTNRAMWKGEWAGGGPYRAVASLSRRKWEWATLPWHSGLTILRKKAGVWKESRIKVSLKRLLRSFSPRFAAYVQQQFHKAMKRLKFKQ